MARKHAMRFITVYLGIYFALVAGAGIALWTGGVWPYLPPLGTALTLVAVAALGVLALVVWRWNPRGTREP